MKLTFSNLSDFNVDAKDAKGALVVLADNAAKHPKWLQALDKKCGEKISHALKTSRFEFKKKQILTLIAPEGVAYDHIILVGLGELKKLGTICCEKIGGAIVGECNKLGVKSASLLVNDIEKAKVSTDEAALRLATGIYLKSYQFDKYRTKIKECDKPTFAKAEIVVNSAATIGKAFKTEQSVLDGTFFTRDLVNEPGNILHPESYAKIISEKLKPLGVKIETLGEKEMTKLGFGALLGVGQGSVIESKMVIMHYNGAGKDDQPIAFVGKGVTFDTGGISIKPSNGMEDMKMDMGGSGAVVGLMHALASRKAKVNVVGVVGLVENMPDGNAQRPGDIVTSYSGQTIEVLNTDAEGRLVLADCLWYTQERFKPKFMVDLATLTGAVLVALGETKAALYANEDKLVTQLQAASKATGEELWHMPLGDEYDQLLKSDIADMQNISSGRWGGSITAAQFLQRFTNETPWVHLDIAGTATYSKANDLGGKGGSGFGVRLLNEFVKENYEG